MPPIDAIPLNLVEVHRKISDAPVGAVLQIAPGRPLTRHPCRGNALPTENSEWPIRWVRLFKRQDPPAYS